jgi:cytochrome P450
MLLGPGLIISEDELWKRQRSMMQPFFHRRILTQFADTIGAVNDRFIARWAEISRRGEQVNLTDQLSELALEIVLRSIIGTDLDHLSRESGGSPFDVVTKEQGRNLQFAFKFRALAKPIAALIARRRATGAEHFDFLGMLLGARDKDTGQPMSDREVIDEVLTLIVAGHETSASSLNLAWYLISQHPEVEARLHSEIDAAPEMPAPTIAQMEALPYARQVIDETLRLYPPAWLVPRCTIEPDVLGGYAVPAGTNVLMPLYLLHRHPRFWTQPEAFLPERFAAEHETSRPRFAYAPFGAGPRHCIGESLAIYEMLAHLYKVARHYRLTYASDKPLEFEAQINLRTRYPLHMKLERR